jgi:hypothetical protein
VADQGAVDHSVAGSWLGQYFYPGGIAGSNFEAVFIQVGSAIEGNILDAGGLGEARAAGSFSYPRISFRKAYVAGGYAPIDYVGAMNDEGKIMLGYWHIDRGPGEAPMHGIWVMYRDGSEEKFDLQKLASEYPLEEEMEKDRDKDRDKEREKQPTQIQ